MIYYGNFALAWGSFVLYLTNLVAILLIGVVMFIFYGFNPHREHSESSVKRIGVLILMTFVLWFVLSSGLGKIEKNRAFETNTYDSLVLTLEENLPGAKVKDFAIREDEDGYVIHGQLFIDQDARITRGKMNTIKSQISEAIDAQFELELDIVRTVSVEAEE